MRFKPPVELQRVVGVVAAAAVLASASHASAEIDGYVTNPVWTARPSTRDLERLYPPNVHGVTANVSADCLIDQEGKFSSCDIVQEDPSGLGFGESTIKLSKLFRMKAVDAHGVPVAGRKLRLPIRWWASFGR